MDLILVTAPTSEPISVSEAKAHMRVDISDDDTMIGALIKAAREQAEAMTGRAFLQQTWRLFLDAFPNQTYPYSLERRNSYRSGQIELHRTPLQSATITYVDINGATQPLDPSQYVVDTNREPGRVYPAYNIVWPVTREIPHAVTVEFIAGASTATKVDQSIKQAMLMMVANWYENRELFVTGSQMNAVPLGAEALLRNNNKVYSV